MQISSISKLGRLANAAAGEGSQELCFQAYDWCVNLGPPAALVAGAVVATLYEGYRHGGMEIQPKDTPYSQFAKKATTVLLLSAFALQIISIFVTTVTGTMLLTRDFSKVQSTVPTALGFLREHFEFEYLSSRITFLQGLLNWLGAMAIEYSIPRAYDDDDSNNKASRYLDLFAATSLGTLILFLLSFYDNHLGFYKNYAHMLKRWMGIFGSRFFEWPPRPLVALSIPGIISSVYFFVRAMRFSETEDHEIQLQKREL